MRGYSLFEVLMLAFDYLQTKIFYSKARLVRLPHRARNKKYIDYGKGLTTGRYCRIDAFPLDRAHGPIIRFGKSCQINDFVHIGAINKVVIGNNVLIASRVFITDHNHGSYSGDDHSIPTSLVVKRSLSSSPVELKDNCWVGEGVCIMPGVTIGENSIVAANSVVTKDVESNTIVAGVPAKAIKRFDFSQNKWLRCS